LSNIKVEGRRKKYMHKLVMVKTIKQNLNVFIKQYFNLKYPDTIVDINSDIPKNILVS
jgi:hypothetical protein